MARVVKSYGKYVFPACNPCSLLCRKLLDSRVNGLWTYFAKEHHIVYLQGNWKNNLDNMELQSDSGRIVLTYYAKSVNLIGRKGREELF